MDRIYVDCPECHFRNTMTIDPSHKETRFSCGNTCSCMMIVIPLEFGVYEIRNAKDEVRSIPTYDASDY